ncbi:hypothetical protein AV530_011883 [Patagioenas fasciata monilis]|uniref:Uncharacterized protein n=1 Tax=Patagioenas fasciata monilis TaxID=372326 RepID=A0A1V4JU10_PATFA|nr:hypothetical protein AV530_011883 [Patagioenas fasciata monilis]
MCRVSAGTPFPGGTEDANLLICGTLVSLLNQKPRARGVPRGRCCNALSDAGLATCCPATALPSSAGAVDV